MDYTKSTTRTANISAADWSMFMDMTERQQDAWLAEQWFAVTNEPFDPGADKYIIGTELKMTYTHCAACGVELPTPYTDGEEGEAFCANCIERETAYREADGIYDEPAQWEIEENGGPTLVEIRQYRWPNTPDAEEYVVTVEANRDGPAWSQVAC